jgi:hypothetical protein
MRKFAAYGFSAVVAILAALLICAAHVGYWGLKLHPEVDAVEVSTLAFTIILTLLVQYYLAGRMTTSRAEKDLLLENVRESISLLKTCRETLGVPDEVAPPKRKETLLQLRRLSNMLEILETALEMSECKTLAAQVRPIREEYLSFKGAATRTPGGKPYTVGDRAEQERAYQKLRKLLQSLLFNINKHQ